MRHFEILVSRDGLTVDKVKTRWYLVERALNGLCRITRCCFCHIGPMQTWQCHALNTHQHFLIPADQAQVQAFADWAGYNIGKNFWRDWEDFDDE